jgi:hypothetical protein
MIAKIRFRDGPGSSMKRSVGAATPASWPANRRTTRRKDPGDPGKSRGCYPSYIFLDILGKIGDILHIRDFPLQKP